MTTLLFTLMCRANNASKIALSHFALSPSRDSISIVLPVTKGDQEGVKSYPRTVHDSPNDPFSSVYLALFVHVFTQQFQLDHNNLLFGSFEYAYEDVATGEGAVGRVASVRRCTICKQSGHNKLTCPTLTPNTAKVIKTSGKSKQQNNYCKWMHNVFSNLTKEKGLPWVQSNLGINPDEIAAHSWRKGVATFLAGLVDGPSMAHIFLRAAWSLGNVQNRYSWRLLHII